MFLVLTSKSTLFKKGDLYNLRTMINRISQHEIKIEIQDGFENRKILKQLQTIPIKNGGLKKKIQ